MTKKPHESQEKLFRDAARALETDESEARFDDALKTVARQKPKADDTPAPPDPKGGHNR